MVQDGPAAASGVVEVGDTPVLDGPVCLWHTHKTVKVLCVGDFGTHKTVKAIVWPGLSGKSRYNILRCSLFISSLLSIQVLEGP